MCFINNKVVECVLPELIQIQCYTLNTATYHMGVNFL